MMNFSENYKSVNVFTLVIIFHHNLVFSVKIRRNCLELHYELSGVIWLWNGTSLGQVESLIIFAVQGAFGFIKIAKFLSWYFEWSESILVALKLIELRFHLKFLIDLKSMFYHQSSLPQRYYQSPRNISVSLLTNFLRVLESISFCSNPISTFQLYLALWSGRCIHQSASCNEVSAGNSRKLWKLTRLLQSSRILLKTRCFPNEFSFYTIHLSDLHPRNSHVHTKINFYDPQLAEK